LVRAVSAREAEEAAAAAIVLTTAAEVEVELARRLHAALDAAGIPRAGLLALESERIILSSDEP